MPAEHSSDVKLEIGHVLFIDIVGYSKGLINEQSDLLQKLKEIVRGTEQFRAAEAEGKLLRLPTGDGGALVFRNSPEAPVLCAMEIAKALKSHPGLRVRMGVHSGPVNEISDLNEQANIAGAGINLAQRVMDCGDAGHILLSRHVAEDLEHYPRWQAYLHELGECEVKHGVRISVVNLYNDEVGNATVPEKFRKTQAVASPPQPMVARSTKPSLGLLLGIASLVALAILAFLLVPRFFRSRDKAETNPTSAKELQAIAVAAKSIAVLPFENLSSDKENAYFAEGIQDEILTRLAKIAALKVISRTSTQKYKSAPDNLREVGKQLGVANLLEGSVQKIANAVHVNVQLIRAETDEHLWAESYNRKLDDVFGVEGEVAAAIADQLNAKLTGAEEKAVADKPTQNVAAYDAYLRGVSLESIGNTSEQAQQVAADFAEAVRLDPKFAVAWARLALTRSYLYFNGLDLTTNSAAAVKDAADRAFALQPDLGESWLAQGVYRYRVLRDFAGALQSYLEALKRLPNSSLVFEHLGHVERRLGKAVEAEKHYEMASQLDPRNIRVLSSMADISTSLRQFDAANATLDRILEISPGDASALAAKAINLQNEGRLDESAKVVSQITKYPNDPTVALAITLQFIYQHRWEDAIAAIQRSITKEPDPRSILLLGQIQESTGKRPEARGTFERVIAAIKPSRDSVVPIDARQLSCFLAWAHAGLGDKNKAVEEARQAVDDYSNDVLSKPFAEFVLASIEARFGEIDAAISALPHLLEVPNGLTRAQLRMDPLWDPLRKDPRFQKLCEEKSK